MSVLHMKGKPQADLDKELYELCRYRLQDTEGIPQVRLGWIGELIEMGANPNATAYGKRTPLMEVAKNGDQQACLALLAYGAQVDVVDGDNVSPLYEAAHYGDDDMCQWFMDRGARHDRFSLISGFAPLHVAAYLGRTSCCKLLIENHGIDVNLRDKHWGHTALFHAACGEYAATFEMLLELGANPKMEDSNLVRAFDYRTHMKFPLHYAASNNNSNICLRLLDIGYDVTEPNQNRFTAIEVAIKRGHRELADMLRSWQARHIAQALIAEHAPTPKPAV